MLNQPEKLSVLLVDDHAVVRTGYRTLLECSGDNGYPLDPRKKR